MKSRLKELVVDKNVSREDLIAICEAAIVPEAKWANRDSASAHQQIGELWALLKAGCEYRIRDRKNDENCRTDSQTIWIDVKFTGFKAFEYAENANERREFREEEMYYLPQPACLADRKGADWY
jgi:hypothetical protein